MVERQTRLEELTARLRERGHRMTPQRMAVIKTLAGNDEHLSAEQIYKRVRVDFPMTSLATIYKTITTLKEMGEVLELGFSDDRNRYDGRDPHPHPHLVCLQCRSIIDVDVPAVSEFPQEVARRTGYRIVSHRLDFFGICSQCQENDVKVPLTN